MVGRRVLTIHKIEKPITWVVVRDGLTPVVSVEVAVHHDQRQQSSEVRVRAKRLVDVNHSSDDPRLCEFTSPRSSRHTLGPGRGETPLDETCRLDINSVNQTMC